MIDLYAHERLKMVTEQLVARGIKDSAVIAAMTKVPRHAFIRDELRGHSYEDQPLPIGNDQTVSQPYMVALMAEALELTGSERILEIGAGSGYAAAVFAELCQEVFSIERIEELAIKARLTLIGVGCHNVRIQIGDGTLGWPEEAPFDAIVISAGAPQIPRPLLEQLKPSGRLVFPMGEEELQTLVRLRRTPAGLKEEYFGECRFVKLRGLYGWEE
ncbi:MAG TPA: protein-L-isoaspartate(D-aspartate) O-methyltransferase [Candidatus Binatia bacterium]|jgi:protein-L-isoaspartate(D-aspartate) O-methyltransferase